MDGFESILIHKIDILNRLESNYRSLYYHLSYYDAETTIRILEENDKILADLNSIDSQLNILAPDTFTDLQFKIEQILVRCTELYNKVTPLLYRLLEKHREELNSVSVQIQLKKLLNKI